jgi:hypothetical protein
MGLIRVMVRTLLAERMMVLADYPMAFARWRVCARPFTLQDFGIFPDSRGADRLEHDESSGS